LEVAEPADAVEGVADDEERPALAHDLEGACDRAVLALVVLPEHGRSIPGIGSIIELTVIKSRFVQRTHPRIPSMTRLSTRISWLPAAAGLFGAAWGANQFTPLLLVYHRELGLGTGTLEALFGAYALGLIPGLLVGGGLSDAHGRRAVVVPAAALSLAATVVLAAAG